VALVRRKMWRSVMAPLTRPPMNLHSDPGPHRDEPSPRAARPDRHMVNEQSVFVPKTEQWKKDRGLAVLVDVVRCREMEIVVFQHALLFGVPHMTHHSKVE